VAGLCVCPITHPSRWLSGVEAQTPTVINETAKVITGSTNGIVHASKFTRHNTKKEAAFSDSFFARLKG